MADAVFDAYSRYYDLLYRDKDYAGEAAFVAAQLRRYAPSTARALELGCGTGAHAEHLARMGFSVHGIDQSETMLARAVARRAGLPPEVAARLGFAPGDARTARTGDTYDAVIALFHVMSYQASDADLRAVFATAAAHLRPGGLFLFDFWYGPAVLAQRPEARVKRLEDERIRVTRNAEPAMREDQRVVDVSYAVSIEDKSTGAVQELRETHRMRYLFLPELAALRAAAFEERASRAWLGEDAPGAQSWSAFQILARTAS
jgi:SAM-dependent methyltransferase